MARYLCEECVRSAIKLRTDPKLVLVRLNDGTGRFSGAIRIV